VTAIAKIAGGLVLLRMWLGVAFPARR